MRPLFSSGDLNDDPHRLIAELTTDCAYALRLHDDRAPTLEWIIGAFEEVTGYTLETLQDAGGWTALLHPDDAHLQDLSTALFDGERTHAEATHRLVHRTGEVRWVRSRARRLEGADGLRIVGAVEDVTKQHEAEAEALTASASAEAQHERDLLALALDAGQLGLWEFDPATNTMSSNARTKEILGLDQDISSVAFLARVHPEDRPRVEAAMRASLQHDTGVFDERYRITLPDGTSRWVHARARTFFQDPADSERPTRAVGVMQDVSAEHAYEETLRLTSDKLQRLTDALPVLVADVDPDLRYRFTNRAFDETFGRSAKTGVGRAVWQVIGERAFEQGSPYHERVRQGEHVTFEINLPTAHGLALHLVRFIPQMKDGAFQGHYIAAVDVSELKQAEAALRRSQEEMRALNATLEYKVRARAQQVQALANALTLAEQRERTRLSQVLHDDLQQILHGLDLHLHFLADDLLLGGDGVPSVPDEVTQSLDRARELTRDALHTTRTLSLELNPPVLSGEGLGHALSWLADHMRERHSLDVALTVSEDLGDVTPERRALLVHLVRELLFNVVKHAGVHAARLRATQHEGYVVVSVEDDGVGFDPVLGTNEGPQTLGLLSVEERLRLVGGRLEVEAAPGKGACCRIALPVTQR